MSDERSGSTRAWRKIRLEVLSESDICGICGHPDSDAVDHIVPVASGGSDEYHNLQPAHHKPCPTCEKTCNLSKGKKILSVSTQLEGTTSRQWF